MTALFDKRHARSVTTPSGVIATVLLLAFAPKSVGSGSSTLFPRNVVHCEMIKQSKVNASLQLKDASTSMISQNYYVYA